MGKLVQSLMKSRIPKEMFKSLKNVRVEMNPFDDSATTARELLRRVETRPVREANPKLEVSVKIVNDYGNPSVNLTYVDGQEHKLDTRIMKIADIMDEIEKVARWKSGGVVNPFDQVRKERAKALGLE